MLKKDERTDYYHKWQIINAPGIVNYYSSSAGIAISSTS